MKNHRIEIYLDAVTSQALRTRSEDQKRTIAQHVRFLVRQDIESSLEDVDPPGKGQTGGREGEL